MDTIIINENAIEPNEYFKILKGQLNESTEDKLTSQLEYVAEQLISAKKAGQEEFLKRLSFTYQTLKKEQLCLANNIDQFVYREDIKKFIDKITPKHSVKIIELSRYPRAIPTDVLSKIQHVKELGIFDDFCVVYTDYTDETVERTEKEKEIIKKDKDPILFGYFKNDSLSLKHDRFYFIVDWVDEYCDLTFNKMLDSLKELGIKSKTIDINSTYLTELVESSLKNTNERNRITLIESPRPAYMSATIIPKMKPFFHWFTQKWRR